MPEPAPDIEMASLEVTTHLDAEIFLIGNDRQLAARAVGKLRTKQPKGLYRIKVTRASAAVEQLLELDTDQTVRIDVPGRRRICKRSIVWPLLQPVATGVQGGQIFFSSAACRRARKHGRASLPLRIRILRCLR
jgi:hypothetical protein